MAGVQAADVTSVRIVSAPHPAARHATVVDELRRAALQVLAEVGLPGPVCEIVETENWDA